MLPVGFEERMQRLLGGDYAAFVAAYDRPRNVGLRRNPLKSAGHSDLTPFALTPVPWEPNGFYYDPQTRPGLSAYHEAGLYYLQEPSAMAPVTLLDVKPGQRVLDLCAAPGGKSTQIAAALAGQGLLVANEIHPKRAKILSRNLERCAVWNSIVLNEHPNRLTERFRGWFHRILVDAPCSGEGMFRKEEAAAEDWSEELVAMCARRQGEILSTAAELLAPGGRLVYSTCTFSPAENEGVISDFLKTHGDFSLVPVENTCFAPGRPDFLTDPAPGLEQTFRLWPHLLRGEGHFAAVLQKNDGEEAAPHLAEATAPPREFTELRQELQGDIPAERFCTFAGKLCCIPADTPELRGLRVLRCGLELGEVLKNRMEPSHAWALWLRDAASAADFREDDPLLRRYLRGEAIPGDGKGWTLITVDGVSLGWGKGSGGVLKNHYPKGLRR